jgi:hypothetical protein
MRTTETPAWMKDPDDRTPYVCVTCGNEIIGAMGWKGSQLVRNWGHPVLPADRHPARIE